MLTAASVLILLPTITGQINSVNSEAQAESVAAGIILLSLRIKFSRPGE